jgi:tryptophanase
MKIDSSDFGNVPPFKIKMTEPIRASGLNPAKRLELLKIAQYNIFRIESADVSIDFLTDSGTNAMSQEQWAAMFLGDEAYAGATSFNKFRDAFRSLTGMEHVLPAHQGRAAERTLFQGLQALGILKKDSIIASNAFFDTTIGWASQFSRCENLYCDDFDLGNSVEKPFKGNLGLSRLEKLVSENPGKVSLVLLTLTNNTGGGQPVSMQNIRELSKFCREHKILFFFDACRFAENAFFIHEREAGYHGKPIKEIVKEMFSYVDGATFSAKKDARTNIGGAVLFSKSNEKIFLACRPFIITNEGLFSYGGMAGRDMDAIAQGIMETTEYPYLKNRVGQVQLLHKLLDQIGVPTIKPAGGHAVYIDAKEYLKQIPETEFRADTLAFLVYAIGGVRCVPIGNLMYAEKDSKGRILKPAKNDFVRLAIPRNVYSLEHMMYVINAFEKIHSAKSKLNRGVEVGEGFRNDHFDHFDCRMRLLDEKNFNEAVLG